MKKEMRFLKFDSVVGINTRIEGTYRTLDSARIDGNIVGDVYAEQKIFIGEKAFVQGNIYAISISIAGKVIGELHASEKVEIETTGNIQGDIYTPSIKIDEKAVFQGKCLMNIEVKEKEEALNERLNEDLAELNKELKELDKEPKETVKTLSDSILK